MAQFDKKTMMTNHLCPNFKDKRGRDWECFYDMSYYDLICVRDVNDRSFDSLSSFHFVKLSEAESFIEALKVSS